MYESNLGAIARAALEAGSAALASFQLKVMAPVDPLLAQTAKDVDEALETLPGDVAFDGRYAGRRCRAEHVGPAGDWHLRIGRDANIGGDAATITARRSVR